MLCVIYQVVVSLHRLLKHKVFHSDEITSFVWWFQPAFALFGLCLSFVFILKPYLPRMVVVVCEVTSTLVETLRGC